MLSCEGEAVFSDHYYVCGLVGWILFRMLVGPFQAYLPFSFFFFLFFLFSFSFLRLGSSSKNAEKR